MEAGTIVKLIHPVRDHNGLTRFAENPVIKRVVKNLDRTMYLVRFADGAETFLFPDEVSIETGVAAPTGAL